MFLILLALSSLLQADVNYKGQTFFSEKPFWYWASPIKLTNFRDGLDLSTDTGQKSLQVVGYGSRTNKPERIAAYFSPDDKCVLRCANMGTDSYFDRTNDIVPSYFGVIGNPIEVLSSTFESLIRFCPKRHVEGLAFNFRYRFGGCGCWWLDASLPLERVRTTMGLQEKPIAPLNSQSPDRVGYVNNMAEGLSNPAMKYQRIDNCWHEKKGVADIELLIGRDWNSMQCGQLRSFLGAVIPTGNKPNGRYIYEPIVGNNHHWGVTWGAEGIFKSWCLDCADVYVVYDIQSKYLFKNQQRRGVDLKGKPWGRYVWVWPNDQATTTDFGANYMTLCLDVTPRYQFDINSAVLFKGSCWTFEAGYNFFARAGEEVCLANKWEERIGYPSIEEFLLTGDVKTASYSMIQVATGTGISTDIDIDENPIFVPIKEEDLNLLSAAHPGMQSQMLYGAFEYKHEGECRDFLAALGASYEFNSHNNAPERWTAWGKVGFSFN